MTRITVCAYSRIEILTNRWCSAVLRTRQFCSNVLCSGSRVSELTVRQSQGAFHLVTQVDTFDTFLAFNK